MSKRQIKRLIILLIGTPFIFAGVFLMTAMLAGGSAGGTHSTGRSIFTHSDSMMLSSTFSSGTATFETSGRMIVVKPTQLIVDGTVVAEIEKNVSSVDVLVKRGMITFSADKKQVPTSLQ